MSTAVKNRVTNLSPETYATTAILAKTAGEQLLARLEWVKLNPQRIIDVGCGTGQSAVMLQQRFANAHVVGVDIDYAMLQYAGKQGVIHQICADTEKLPFADNSVDLIFANFVLPWCHNLKAVLQEWRRVLRPEGLLLFTCLGTDTLHEWKTQLTDNILPQCVDMHDIGDLLVQTKWSDPVVDGDSLTLRYASFEKAFHELQATSMLSKSMKPETIDGNQLAENNHWLTSYEIVFGLAWKPEEKIEQAADEFGTVKFPLSYLRQNF